MNAESISAILRASWPQESDATIGRWATWVAAALVATQPDDEEPEVSCETVACALQLLSRRGQNGFRLAGLDGWSYEYRGRR